MAFRCCAVVSGHFCLGCGGPNLNNEGQTQCLGCVAEDVVVGDISSVSHQAGSGAVHIHSHHVCTSSIKGFVHGTCCSLYDSRDPCHTVTIHAKEVTTDMQMHDTVTFLYSFRHECTKHRRVHLHQQVLTKADRLKTIQWFVENSQAHKIIDVLLVLAKFDDLLVCYYRDYQTEALSDNLQKIAMRPLIPVVLQDLVQYVIMFRSMRDDVLSVVVLKSIIMECIVGRNMRLDVSDVNKTC